MRRALVIGGGLDALEEAHAAIAMAEEADVSFDLTIVANDVGTVWERPITHWASLHMPKMPVWQAARASMGYNTDYKLVGCHNRTRGVSVDLVVRDWGGSSGLLAVQAALAERCERVVCAGVPMDTGPHYHSDARWMHAQFYRVAWRAKRKLFADWTRSMSGWSREMLGAPTPGWLRGTAAQN